MKPIVCYSCGNTTTNFYVNKNTGKRNKYCKDCEKTYTAEERRLNVLKHVSDTIMGMDIKEKIKEKL